MTFSASIELLENRIAPATLVNPTTVVFTDVDGDIVTVKVSKGGFDAGLDEFVFVETSPGRELLQFIDLGSSKFQGANLSITAKRGPDGGDGLVNVGQIVATSVESIDLGNVVIDGDLGALSVGDSDDKTPAIKSLTVQSFGAFGAVTLPGSASSDLTTVGPVGKLIVKGDIHSAMYVGGSIGLLKVGGSVLGNDVYQSANLSITGDIGKVIIGGSLAGGSAIFSGVISAGGNIGSVTIGGSLVGGPGPQSGSISAANFGPIKIRGDMAGVGTGAAGAISASGSIKSLTVGGSIIGGVGNHDPTGGQVFAEENIGPVKIAGSMRGGMGSKSGSITAGSIASVKIGGSLVGGEGTSSGGIFAGGGILGPVSIAGNFEAGAGSGSGVIYGSAGIKSVTIGGSWFRNTGDDSQIYTSSSPIDSVKIGGSIFSGNGQPAILTGGGTIGAIFVGGDIRGGTTIFTAMAIKSISVKGSVVGSETSRLAFIVGDAIGKVSIGGSMQYSLLAALMGDGKIGPVTIGRDFIASSIVAGTSDGSDGVTGTFDDEFAGGGDPANPSTIAKLTIKGQAYGTVGGTDSFLIMAEKIGKITVGGTLIPGSDDPGDTPIGFTGDLAFRDRPVV